MGGSRASRLRKFCSKNGLPTLALLAVGFPGSAVAQVYNQPYSNSAPALASQNDTTLGHFATAYDNFALASPATLGTLTFTGTYFNPGTVGTTTAFEIQIYGDSSGLPGSSIWSSTVPGNGGENCGPGPGDPICTYSVPIDFSAAAGTQYWLSIVSESDVTPQWGWATGSGGDGQSYQQFVGFPPGFATGDRAFALFEASEVPEPATWGLMLVGFLVAMATLRRRTRSFEPA